VSAKRMGRPPLKARERKAAHLSVRFTEDEHRALERAAKAAKLPLSEWARSVILGAATGAGGTQPERPS
jgi:predicted HicB family RNase H-like nuclease